MTLSVGESILIIAVCGAITFLLRALPFLLFGSRPVPKAVAYIGKALPMAVMMTLVIYCVRSVSFAAVAGWLPTLLGLSVTVALHLWRKSTFLSIVGGTGCYMLLVQFAFA